MRDRLTIRARYCLFKNAGEESLPDTLGCLARAKRHEFLLSSFLLVTNGWLCSCLVAVIEAEAGLHLAVIEIHHCGRREVATNAQFCICTDGARFVVLCSSVRSWISFFASTLLAPSGSKVGEKKLVGPHCLLTPHVKRCHGTGVFPSLRLSASGGYRTLAPSN